MQHCQPYARAGGRIVNFSSVGGLIGRAGMGFYNATKSRWKACPRRWRIEVESLGLKVIIVEPGPFRTEFLGRSINAAAAELPAYAATAGKARAYRDTNNGRQGGDPAKAIAVVLKAIDADVPRFTCHLGNPRIKACVRRYLRC